MSVFLTKTRCVRSMLDMFVLNTTENPNDKHPYYKNAILFHNLRTISSVRATFYYKSFGIRVVSYRVRRMFGGFHCDDLFALNILIINTGIAINRVLFQCKTIMYQVLQKCYQFVVAFIEEIYFMQTQTNFMYVKYYLFNK